MRLALRLACLLKALALVAAAARLMRLKACMRRALEAMELLAAARLKRAALSGRSRRLRRLP
jgi:hypothetical protein